MSSDTRLPQRTRPDRVKPPPRAPSPSPTPPSWSAPKTKVPIKTDDNPPAYDSDASSTHDTFHDAHFPPEEEAALLSESNDLKTTANAQFARADYSQAISTYDRALSSCPNYLDFEIAVLQSNIAACHLKLEEWREAIESADRALEHLDRENPPPKPKKSKTKKDEKVKDSTKAKGGTKAKSSTNTSSNSGPPPYSDSESSDEEPPSTNAPVVELPSSDDEGESTTTALRNLNLSDARLASINRIRTKSLLRRARARSSLAQSSSDTVASSFSSAPGAKSKEKPSSWTLLQASLSDYQLLASPTNPYLALLPPSDLRTVQTALRSLPPQIEAAKQKEVGEMMGKLKELGNGILKPFGLSTDMFKMVQDEKTGGYSMNFEQGQK